jgi:hypothetical protein
MVLTLFEFVMTCILAIIGYVIYNNTIKEVKNGIQNTK